MILILILNIVFAQEVEYFLKKNSRLDSYISLEKKAGNKIQISCHNKQKFKRIVFNKLKYAKRIFKQCMCQGDFTYKNKECYCQNKIIDPLNNFISCENKDQFDDFVVRSLAIPNKSTSRIMSSEKRRETLIYRLKKIDNKKFMAGPFAFQSFGESNIKFINSPYKNIKWGSMVELSSNVDLAVKEYNFLKNMGSKSKLDVFSLIFYKDKYYALTEKLYDSHWNGKKKRKDKWYKNLLLKASMELRNLNQNKIYHYNIMPENLYISESLDVKLVNFTDRGKIINSYQDPFLTHKLKQDKLAQIYSLAAVFYKLLNRRSHLQDLKIHNKKLWYAEYDKAYEQIIPSDKSLNSLLWKMLAPREKRLSWDEVIKNLQ